MDKDNLSKILADTINKEFKKKKEQVAFFLDDGIITPTDIPGWISTGSDTLDIIVSNKPHAGLPMSKIIEYQGLEGSGKSLLGAHSLADTQKKGGIAIYIDTESAVSREFLKVIGVNLETLVYIPMDTVEDIFQTVETLIMKVRSSDKDIPVTILIDSLSAASSGMEMEGDFDRDGWATNKALIIGKAMRKLTNLIARQKICLIITSQLRTKLGVMFGDQFTTSGGLAVGFHSSVRIRMTKATKIKDSKTKEIIGINIKASVIKNRIGPPLRNIEFPLYFTSGIDNYGSMLGLLKDYKIIGSSSLEYDNQKIGFTISNFGDVVKEHPGLGEYLYDKLCDVMIAKYQKNKSYDDDDIEITNEQVEG